MLFGFSAYYTITLSHAGFCEIGEPQEERPGGGIKVAPGIPSDAGGLTRDINHCPTCTWMLKLACLTIRTGHSI